jgi:hypothetical protein
VENLKIIRALGIFSCCVRNYCEEEEEEEEEVEMPDVRGWMDHLRVAGNEWKHARLSTIT